MPYLTTKVQISKKNFFQGKSSHFSINILSQNRKSVHRIFITHMCYRHMFRGFFNQKRLLTHSDFEAVGDSATNFKEYFVGTGTGDCCL